MDTAPNTAPAAWQAVRRGLRSQSLRTRAFTRLGELDRARGIGTWSGARGTSDNYGSGARLRSRDRRDERPHSASAAVGPVGPQTATDWEESLDRVRGRAEAAERACRNHAQLISELMHKVEQLTHRVSAQESRGDALREQMSVDRQALQNVGNNIVQQYSTTASNKVIFADLDARVETIGIQMQF